MTINIIHQGIELTPAIHQYTEEKMRSLLKYLDTITHIDVEVGIPNNNLQKTKMYECKAIVQVGGEVIKMEKEAEDLYKAIDKVKDHLRVELTKIKGKLQDRSKGKID